MGVRGGIVGFVSTGEGLLGSLSPFLNERQSRGEDCSSDCSLSESVLSTSGGSYTNPQQIKM